MYSKLVIGNINVTSSSIEAIYAALRNFERKYISTNVCPTDKMEIPITEVIDLSNQIDKKVLDNGLKNRREVFSYSEASLRTLAYETLRVRCIRSKELRASFKQLDRVYHLDDKETRDALKGKRQLVPLCCNPNCNCFSFILKDILTRFPAVIKNKLDTFVSELEILDAIVIKLLLDNTIVESTNSLHKKSLRRQMLLKRSNRLENELLKHFVQNLILSKQCRNITFDNLRDTNVTDETNKTFSSEEIDRLDIQNDEYLNVTLKSKTNQMPGIDAKITSKSLNKSTKLLDDVTKVNSQPKESGSIEKDVESTISSTIVYSDDDKKSQTNHATNQTNTINPSRFKDATLSINNSDTSTTHSTIEMTSRTSLCNFRNKGGLFGRIRGRNCITTTPPPASNPMNTHSNASSSSLTTTKPAKTTTKRRFNPFLRNVFNRG